MSENIPVCFICDKFVVDDVRHVGPRGRQTLIQAAIIRGDSKILKLLEDERISVPDVHSKCYRPYTQHERVAKRIEKERASSSNHTDNDKPDTSSNQEEATPEFDWKRCCFYCGKVKINLKKCKISGSCVKDRVLEMLQYRTEPEYLEIKSRIRNVDLVEKGACYHPKCQDKYRRQSYEAVVGHVGRSKEPVDRAMEYVYAYIDEHADDCCQFSLSQLAKLIPDNQKIDSRILLERIKTHYKEENLVIHSSRRDGTIVCFKNISEKLLQEAWNRQVSDDTTDEDVKNTRKIARRIREQIRSREYEKDLDKYPRTNTFTKDAEKDVPDLLSVFLEEIILAGKKKNSLASWKNTATTIAHMIIKAARPRCFLSSILLGLGCFLKKKFGSRLLIDSLAAIGLSCSYSEVQLLELSCIAKKQPTVLPTAFFQWVADNADFNINTLDGHNSWHVMGLIQCVTPMDAIEEEEQVIRKVHERRSIDPAEIGKIELIPYEGRPYDGLGKIQILDLQNLYPLSTPITPDFKDLLFVYGKWKCDQTVPGWNGFMEQISEACPYEISKVLFHPFINAPPSEKMTVNTTLSYICDATESSGQKTPVINFDQQLYWIARDIAENVDKYKDVFVRLGGFHLLISFMGAICKIMSGSGLEQLWATIYAEGSISQMVIGKAYSRAVRAHLLTNLSLAKIILDSMDEEDSTFEDTRDYLDGLLDDIDRTNVVGAVNEESSIRFRERFQRKLSEFENRGPTAKLWVQYYRMTCLLKQFLEAERTGNWPLYVSTIRSMVPFFYSCGHNNYAKSAHLYLQDIATLEKRMPPSEYDKFTKQGFFTIRRSNKFFSGISPDQTIEQTTMRLAKTQGGLTLPGRGITDNETAKWALSMYSLMNICEQFESFVGVYGQTSEQHVEMRPARVERDNKDVHILDCWFARHNPFPNIGQLVSIGTGVVGDETVNCHVAEEEGIKLMSDAMNYTFKTLTLKRDRQVKPLSIMTAKLKVMGKVVAIDPMLIFQRIAISGATPEDLEEFLQYELAPYPLSLFDESGMRKGTKSSFYEAFSEETQIISKENCFYVIDGGYLLHKVRWKDMTIDDICKKYVTHLQKHYSAGKIAVIFDGYPPESDIGGTKSAERLRRSAKYNAPSIEFDRTTFIKVGQENFLSNESNKDRLISFLQHELEVAGFETQQAFEDADRLIVQTALQKSSYYTSVFIIGEDVDLLVLLVALCTTEHNVYLKKPASRNTSDKFYSTQSFKYKPLKKYVLLLHAFSGCDTTSAPYMQGKLKFIKSLIKIMEGGDDKEITDLQATMDYFYDEFTPSAVVQTAGQTMFSAMYNNGSTTDTLAKTRFKKFSQSAAKTKFNLCSLPPSPDAANFHSERVYLQVQTWLQNDLDPKDWGWKRCQLQRLKPITTLREPASSRLMNLISCSCSVSGCGSQCGCRKAGVPCSVACKYCSGEDCSNARVIEVEDDDFLDDDELDVPCQVVHFRTRSSSNKNNNQQNDRQSSGSSSTETTRSESPQEPPPTKRLRSARAK